MPSSSAVTNARFVIEIDGLARSDATEALLPSGRISGALRSRRVDYGPLVLRRGVSASNEWYAWWDNARGGAPALRSVVVTVLDDSGAPLHRWIVNDARPIAYAVSPLNALKVEPLLETLELEIKSFRIET